MKSPSLAIYRKWILTHFFFLGGNKINSKTFMFFFCTYRKRKIINRRCIQFENRILFYIFLFNVQSLNVFTERNRRKEEVEELIYWSRRLEIFNRFIVCVCVCENVTLHPASNLSRHDGRRSFVWLLILVVAVPVVELATTLG